MNVIMLAILMLIGIIAATGLLMALRFGFSFRRLKQGPILRHTAALRGAERLAIVPFFAWAALFLLVLPLLLAVGGVSLLYVFALFHGEWFQLLDSLPKTAGNIAVHLIYPLQMFLFAFLTFYLAVGGFQLIFGAVEKLRRLSLCVDDFRDFARKLAGALAIITGMEVVKILAYSLLVAPDRLGEFFARDTLPKADPLTAALLAAAILVAVAAWWRAPRDGQ